MNVVPTRLTINPGNGQGQADLYPRSSVIEQSIESPLLGHLISVVRRRKWILIGATLGTLLLGIVITTLLTPKYTASNLIEIQREGTTMSAVDVAQPKASTTDAEFYETQYGLLKSDSLADRVSRDLNLYNNAHFLTISGAPKSWFVNGKIANGVTTRETRLLVTRKMLLGGIKVNSERQSRLVKLEYTSPDPVLAKQIVDAWARAFIQVTLDRRYEASSFARRFLEVRLGQLRERIDQAERQLVNYARQQQIINIPAPQAPAGSVAAGDRPLVAENLSALNAELSAATADRVRAESRRGLPSGSSTEVLQNSSVNMMRQQRTELAANYAKLMVQFEPSYPPAQAIKSQLTQLDAGIAREEARVASSLQNNYQAAVARENQLKSQVQALQGQVLDFRQRSIQYNIYQRDADTNRQLYDALLQRYKEIGVAGGVGVNNISIVDEADVPSAPSSPNWIINIAFSILLGLVIGSGVILLLEQLDQGISDPREVESKIGVPLLGTIPLSDTRDILGSLGDPKSALYEAYLSLRTNLGFTTEHGLPRSLLVTSARPGEGKSTTSLALACSIARAGLKTILVDADMRAPSVHYELGMPNGMGLSNFLSGNDNLDSLVRGTKFQELDTMTAGPQPPNSAELLSSNRVALLIERLLQTYSHVILDVPPVMGIADAPVIGSLVEGAVFVIESHVTDKNMILVAIERMRAANVNLLGAVLTKFDAKQAGYGYGYGYSYSYGGEDNVTH